MGLSATAPYAIMDLDALIRRAKAKDQGALDTLYRTYYRQMLGVCMSIVREDRGTAEDLVHDAFIMAFVSIGSLRDPAKFGEWLTTIVRNVSLKHIEQRNRIRVLPLSSIQRDESVFIDTSATPDADLHHKELLALIGLLPKGYRNILRLSVIEGFSHKEIADMLGIQPHSSSSQLARARFVLKRLLGHRAIGLMVLLLLPLAWYLLSRHEAVQRPEEMIISEKRGGQQRPGNEHLQAEQQAGLAIDNKDTASPYKEVTALATKDETQAITPDADSIAMPPRIGIDSDAQTAEAVEDSTESIPRDSAVIRPVVLPEIHLAERPIRRKNTWQILAGGSLGPAMAQSDYTPLAVDGSRLPEPDIPSAAVPDHVNTWEEYAHYLMSIPASNASADTPHLIEIANHNAGKIEQREHHDKPVTLGLSVTKSLSRRWSLETGVQYSLLNSRFTMGADGYAVVARQRVHYLGLPLRVSYNWVDYKRLSAYSAVGASLHIPVGGKVSTAYLVNGQRAYAESGRAHPSLQWQTNVALGVQYRFAPNASLFAEPTLNWFIPSGSDTHTIWTERPLMFTCPLGLRITW